MDQVLVFDGPKYVNYTHRNNFNNIGEYGRAKYIINTDYVSGCIRSVKIIPI